MLLFFIKPIYNMFEKVSPSHPDKLADRIAGAIVDLAYTKAKNPRIATEVLLGHGECNIQVETSEQIGAEDIEAIVSRIAGEGIETRALIVPQDIHLAANQQHGVRCGDNGIFRGVPPTHEQKLLTAIAATMWERFKSDGKYIIGRYRRRDGKHFIEPSEDDDRSLGLTICQSNATNDEILDWWHKFGNEHLWDLQEKFTFCFGRDVENRKRYISLTKVNPLGEWTGGVNVDCGAVNRKLGSDMGDGVSGGGINGKDLSKGDVSINIVCFLKAVQSGQTVTACCSIGDEQVTFQYASGKTETETFADVVEMARLYILTDCNGSFETFSEWGLIRPKL